MSAIVREHFPQLAARMQHCVDEVSKKYSIPKSPFGLFWNYCINTPIFEEGIKNVFCAPHIDAQNGALLVCAVFVFYYGACEYTIL